MASNPGGYKEQVGVLPVQLQRGSIQYKELLLMD